MCIIYMGETKIQSSSVKMAWFSVTWASYHINSINASMPCYLKIYQIIKKFL